jgi:flagellar biosynthesis protein FlhF
MREALLQVKEELGPDALILRTQKIRGSLLGGGERWEVTAGLEDRFYEKPAEPHATGAQPVLPTSGYGPGSRKQQAATGAADFQPWEPPQASPTVSTPLWRPSAPPPEPERYEPPPETTAISRDEFRALQDGIESVRRATEAPTQAIAAVKAEMGALRSVVSALADHWKDHSDLPVDAALLPFYQQLLDSDVANDFAQEACQAAAVLLKESGRDDEAAVRQALVRSLAARLPCSPLRVNGAKGSRSILFAGPTGVGKTTTVMKLAIRLSRQDGRKVGIVGCDAYRIGAQEQIRTFCDVAGIPLRNVFTDADLDTALTDLSDCDVILVDTAGRSPANQIHFLELSTLVERIKPAELVLVQSATTRLRDLTASVRAYRDLGPTRLIFTKIDETDGHGSLCTLVAREKIPVAALCFGQEIPEHIADAASEEMARMVLGDENVQSA